MESCVGYAVGYAAMSTYYNAHNSTVDTTASKISFSPLFIYNQIKLRDCNFGAQIDDALALIQNTGNISYEEFDVHIDDCHDLPTSNQLKRAHKFRVMNGYKLFGPKEQDDIIENVKLSIADSSPVILALIINNGFKSLRLSDKYWNPITGDQTLTGAHAVTVIGYDDFEECFEIMNSWGTGWGQNGYFKMRYKDFKEQVKYGFVFDGGFITADPDIGSFNIEVRRFSQQNDIYNSQYSNINTEVGPNTEIMILGINPNDAIQIVISDLINIKGLSAYINEMELLINIPNITSVTNAQFDNSIPPISNNYEPIIIPSTYSALRLTKRDTLYIKLIKDKDHEGQTDPYPLPNRNSNLMKRDNSESNGFIFTTDTCLFKIFIDHK